MNFEEKYFVKSDISNYRNYKDKKFHGLAEDLKGLLKGKKVLDFGCATGGLTAALRAEEIDCIGTDISYWAITFGREAYGLPPAVLQFYNRQLLDEPFDVVLFLDVLEHISTEELHAMFKIIKAREIIVRIPVALCEGQDYLLEVSRNDKTHIQVHSKGWWRDFFLRHGYEEKGVIAMESIYDAPGVMAMVFVRRN